MTAGRRSARRLLAAGAVALALAGAAAGCGGDVQKDNAYVDRVNLAQTQFASSFARLSREITASSTPAHDRKTLRAIEGSINTTVTDLRAIHPPDKVKSLHGDLVDAIAAYGDAIGTAEQNLGGHRRGGDAGAGAARDRHGARQHPGDRRDLRDQSEAAGVIGRPG